MHSYMVGVERFGEEESRRWVARFDEPDGDAAPIAPISATLTAGSRSICPKRDDGRRGFRQVFRLMPEFGKSCGQFR